jgi:hypothetical protein
MKPLCVAVYTNPKGWPYPASWWRLRKSMHRFQAGRALAKAVVANGHHLIVGKAGEPLDADIAVVWSWKQHGVIEHQHKREKHLLVLERGFLQPRMQWVSLTWDGFNGRGRFPPAPEMAGTRESQYFARLKPWRQLGGKKALVVGQVPGDAALRGLDVPAWAQSVTDDLKINNYSVTYRPHPSAFTPCPSGAKLSSSTLTADLAATDVVIVYNSTAAVEAIIEGVPTIVMDEGSVAYAMGSHTITEPLKQPDRTQWLRDLAWRQWSLEELADGSAWRFALQQFTGIR